MTAWRAAVDELDTLTLDEVDKTAALQTRVDRKYLVQPRDWENVLAGLRPAPRVLQIGGRRSFRYVSTYYDTPDLRSYLDAARRRPYRFKVRTRYYLDTGAGAVEVKLRSVSGATSKKRRWLEDASAGAPVLPPTATAFVGSFDRIGERADVLRKTLSTSYERVTLVTDDARVTVDSRVAATDASGRRMDYGDLLVVETKSAGGVGAVDRALWASGIRPSRISKYCTSLAALHPELPANRWSRTLRRHVTAAGPGAAAGEVGLT